MGRNRQTVETYMDGFNKLDHAQILECLTDDVEWVIPGMFHTHGKAEFDAQIENDAFIGCPNIKLLQLIEEKDIVVAEGSVTCVRADGGILNVVFCDIFEMRNGKIRKLTSYLMEVRG